MTSEAESGFVFLSYSRQDEHYAERLVTHLENAGIPVWMDDKIPSDARWLNVIEGRIDACAVMVVLMTPAAEASVWVRREIARMKPRGPIAPLLLSGERWHIFEAINCTNVTDGQIPGPTFTEHLRMLTGSSDPPPPDENDVDTSGIDVLLARHTGGRVDFVVRFPAPRVHYHAFIDTDGDDRTGYQRLAVRFGANYMIENKGLYRSHGPDWEWDQVYDVNLQQYSTDGTVRWSVPESRLALRPDQSFRVLFHASTDGSYDIYGKPMLIRPQPTDPAPPLAVADPRLATVPPPLARGRPRMSWRRRNR